MCDSLEGNRLWPYINMILNDHRNMSPSFPLCTLCTVRIVLYISGMCSICSSLWGLCWAQADNVWEDWKQSTPCDTIFQAAGQTQCSHTEATIELCPFIRCDENCVPCGHVWSGWTRQSINTVWRHKDRTGCDLVIANLQSIAVHLCSPILGFRVEYEGFWQLREKLHIYLNYLIWIDNH